MVCLKQIFFVGSLLGQFVAPIYFDSVILGSFFHNEHFSRAIITRCASLPDLPPQYSPQEPLLSGITSSEGRVPGRAPSFAVNWTEGEGHIEAITTVRGKTEDGLPSKICKLEMFCLYDLARQTCPTRKDVTQIEKIDDVTYAEVKDMNASYREAKQVFARSCKERELGNWVGKPREQEEFTLKEAQAAAAAVVAAAARRAGMTRQQLIDPAAGSCEEEGGMTGSLFFDDVYGDEAMMVDGGRISQLQEQMPAAADENGFISLQLRQIRNEMEGQEVKSNDEMMSPRPADTSNDVPIKMEPN